jgi:hypothetical protein
MSQHYEIPQRDCLRCAGYTFPNGCANFCDNFEDEADFEIADDDFELDPSDATGEIICDNCFSSTTGHCPGQLDCDKWHMWAHGSPKAIDEKDMEPRTIGFHLLNSDQY